MYVKIKHQMHYYAYLSNKTLSICTTESETITTLYKDSHWLKAQRLDNMLP